MRSSLTDEKLAGIVSNVRDTLERNYSDIGLGVLAEYSKAIEMNIENLVVKLIWEFFTSLENFAKLSFREFQFNGSLYEIRAGASVNTPELEIWVLTSSSIDSVPASDSRTIPGAGYYKSFSISVPKELSVYLSELGSIIHAAYSSAYVWQEDCFFRGLAELEKGFTEKLYSSLRMALAPSGKSELAEKIWFSIFSEKNGYYALDSKAAEGILARLKERKYISEFSPIYHVCKLIGLEMPYQKSFSKYSIESNRYKDFTLSKAAYVSDMSHIYKTEEQMVNNSGYAIFPIATVGDRKLVVSFPANLKSDLIGTLEAQKEDLSEIYKKEVKIMGKHISKIKSSYHRMDSSELGGFIGGMIGGIYNNL